MPIYEYSCGKCSNRFQLKQGFDSETVAVCPDCGSSSQRLFSPPAIVFKGSGWYATDYKGSYQATTDNRREEKEAGAEVSGKRAGDGEKAAAAAPAASSDSET